MESETALYFTSICRKGSSGVYLAGHLIVEEAEPTGTAILSLDDGKWAFVCNLPDVVTGMISDPDPDRDGILALGRTGTVYDVTSTGQITRNLELPTRGPTYLNGLSEIDSRAIIFGGSNQVFSRVHDGWTQIDKGIFRDFVVGELHAIYAALPLPDQRMILGGRLGFMAAGTENEWEVQEIPTNLSIHGLEWFDDERFVAVGSGGLFLIGYADGRWKDLTEELQIGKTIWGIKQFQGLLFLGLGQELVALEETEPFSFEIAIKRRMEVNSFCVNDALWCIGGELVHRFDGKHWVEFLCPTNS